jgi:hypothetical protein
MAGSTIELAFVTERHPERAVLLPGPTAWWGGRGDASTRVLISQLSRMVAAAAHQRRPDDGELGRGRPERAPAGSVDELTFVWGSVAEAATLLLLDIVVDGEQGVCTAGQLAAEAVRRVDARRFRRATGIVEDEQPGIIAAAAAVIFRHPWRGAVAYRGRLVDVLADGRVVTISPLATDREPRWAGPGGVTPQSLPVL